MTRAEIRAQMVAMKASMGELYMKPAVLPTTKNLEEQRISSMSMTQTANLKRSLQTTTRSTATLQPYMGPHVAGFGLDKNHMPVVTNDAHSTSTNNGFARKPCGGFYFH